VAFVTSEKQYHRFIQRSADRADLQPSTYELQVFYIWARRFQRCLTVVCPMLNPGHLYDLAVTVSGIPADDIDNGHLGHSQPQREDAEGTPA
jgi:hypothetical protein